MPDANTLSAYAAVGAVAVSLVAVVIGPLIQLRTTKAQIAQAAESSREQLKAALHAADLGFRASVLSANRQAWINDLRERIADFTSASKTLRMQWEHWRMSRGQTKLGPSEFAVQIADIGRRESLLQMMLNPREQDHVELTVRLSAVKGFIDPDHGTGQELETCCRDLIAQAGAVLKREWERVKKSE